MKMIRSVPVIPVIRIDRAVEFYSLRLGFTCGYQDVGYAVLTRDEIQVHLWAAGDESWRQRHDLRERPVSTGAESFLAGTGGCRIEVQGIDALYAEYKSKGVLYSPDTVVKATAWKTREFPALDLHRNLLTLFERVGPEQE